jgi:hypothetical protein
MNKIKVEIGHKDKLLNQCFCYKLNDGNDMVELHVDDNECLQCYAKRKPSEFGGSISARAPTGENPIVVFGQDEAINSQNADFSMGRTKRQETTTSIISGIGMMISAFQSRVTCTC